MLRSQHLHRRSSRPGRYRQSGDGAVGAPLPDAAASPIGDVERAVSAHGQPSNVLIPPRRLLGIASSFAHTGQHRAMVESDRTIHTWRSPFTFVETYQRPPESTTRLVGTPSLTEVAEASSARGPDRRPPPCDTSVPAYSPHHSVARVCDVNRAIRGDCNVAWPGQLSRGGEPMVT